MCCLAIISPPAQAAGAPQALTSNQMLRGHFVQERQMAGFAKPLKSEGSFALLPARGLIWRNEKPFINTTVISSGGIVQLAGSQETMRLNATRIPGLAQLYLVLSAALSGETAPLKKSFTVERREIPNGWEVSLKPLNPTLQAQIKMLVLKGGRYVESVEIDRAGGDSDHITFSDHSVTKPDLTTEESASLAAANK
jgi:hypothetical protein